MRTSTSIDDTRQASREARHRGQSVGVVPTMGALHAGHVSLIEAARRDCDFVVVTIFVNPTQFGPGEDLDRYPRTLEHDLQLCREAGADFVFHPDAADMYRPGADTVVEVVGLSRPLEGEYRSGHFRGVTTVVMKLFHITEPDVAFFGQKDYQQQLLIRRMCCDLNLPVEIRTCPIVREPDGLALSSRNRYLTASERRTALRLSESLRLGKQLLVDERQQDVAAVLAAMHDHLAGDDLTIDYLRLVDPETLTDLTEVQDSMVALVAARVGTTRLIDNDLIQPPAA